MDVFPSPCGDYGSYLAPSRLTRPLFGAFPSPCGDYGSYRLEVWEVGDDGTYTFPSPCGDYGSYRRHSNIQTTFSRSFRPLAGIMVLICTGMLV